MKKKLEARASTVSSASAEDIYSLLANSATYPAWSMIERYESLRPGRGGIDGVGALRAFQTGPFVMKEEIVEAVPNERVSYTLLSGFPLLDYHSTTSLSETSNGTLISWTSTFHAKYAMTGLFWRWFMIWTLRRMVRGLARAAEDPQRRSEILGLVQGRLPSEQSNIAIF